MTDNENCFLFLLCTNHGGSSLFAKLLCTCSNVIHLDSPLHEGHLINGIGEYLPTPMTHNCVAIWTEKAGIFEDGAQYKWEHIKNIWMENWRKNQKYRTAHPAIMFEKSPPNLLRAKLLEENFPGSHFIIMVRNPYAIAEGIRRRDNYPLDRCIRHWIRATRKQVENIETLENRIWFTYEQLCEYPQIIKKRLIDFIPQLRDLDITSNVTVHSIKGNINSGLINYNAQQIARLSADDIQLINSHLESNLDLLAYFGYQLLRPA